MNVEREREPRLGTWLLRVAEGIDVWPDDPDDPMSAWRVEVNNGLYGHAGAGSTVAICRTDLEAELVACALWAFVNSRPLLAEAAAALPPEAEPPSITCPECQMTSYNPNDIATGYCGKCHKFTSNR